MRRADFLRAAKGKRWHGTALTLQATARGADEAEQPPRLGFTLTKKVGCAVIRNRARRRLREALRLSVGLQARPGHDYVVIGRIAAIRVPFAELQSELARAFIGVHDAGRRKRREAGRDTSKVGAPG